MFGIKTDKKLGKLTNKIYGDLELRLEKLERVGKQPEHPKQVLTNKEGKWDISDLKKEIDTIKEKKLNIDKKLASLSKRKQCGQMSRSYYRGHYCDFCKHWVKTTEMPHVFESGICSKCYYKLEMDECFGCKEWDKSCK